MTDGRSAWYRFVQFLMRRVGFPVFGGIEVRGVDRVPRDGAIILAPNHLSYLDPPAVGCAFPRFLASMARESLFRFPLGPFIRSIGVFPIRQGAGDTEAIRHALETLEKGHAVLIFPEGTRGTGERLGALQPGVALLAKRSGAWVLPCGIAGSHIALPRRGKRRRHRTVVVYGEPFRFEDVAGEGNERARRERFGQALSERIAELADEGGMAFRSGGAN